MKNSGYIKAVYIVRIIFSDIQRAMFDSKLEGKKHLPKGERTDRQTNKQTKAPSVTVSSRCGK